MSEVVDGNSINTPSVNSNSLHSTFPLSHRFLYTSRFGEVSPHFVFNAVEDDTIPYRNHEETRSYTMKAPLLENIRKHKDYYMVPLEAILPNNWQKYYQNPVKGEDIDPEEVGCNVVRFGKFAYYLINRVLTQLGSEPTWSTPGNIPYRYLSFALSWLPLCESIYSRGSLVHMLGAKGISDFVEYNPNGDVNTTRGFDVFYQDFLNELVASFESLTVQIGGSNYFINFRKTDEESISGLNLHEMLELLRDDSRCIVQSYVLDSSHTPAFATIIGNVNVRGSVDTVYKFNLERLWAYQMVCSCYYTNDQVDYIYNADLFRQYVYHCFLLPSAGWASTSYSYFTLNALNYQYDYLSAHMFNVFTETASTGLYAKLGTTIVNSNNAPTASAMLHPYLPYLQCIFRFNRSLRFVDYFTGVRSHPLAVVGNGSAGVSGPFADVIDITKKIQVQRFLNAINRGVHKFSDSVMGYVKTLFGVDQKPDYHYPFYIAQTTDVISTQENENTGDLQFSESSSVTSVFRSNSDKFAFNFYSDRRCIIIGVTWYDIPRAYAHSTSKFFMHVNRYDMFNPYLQFVGDVPVELVQKNTFDRLGSSVDNSTFGYTAPYMEYKQSYNTASGGFVDGSLPGWAFIADEGARMQDTSVISPNYIRSSPSELDKFYVSLSGDTLSNYFHFINVCDNIMEDVKRPMAYDPKIL